MNKIALSVAVSLSSLSVACGPTAPLSAMTVAPSWGDIEILTVGFIADDADGCPSLAGPATATVEELEGTFEQGGALGGGCARPRFLFTDPADDGQDGGVTLISENDDNDLVIDVEAGGEGGAVVVKDGLSYMALADMPERFVVDGPFSFAVSHPAWPPTQVQLRNDDGLIDIDVTTSGDGVDGVARKSDGSALATGAYELEVTVVASDDAYACEGFVCETGLVSRLITTPITIE